MGEIRLEWVPHGSEAWRRMVALRHRVLREPLELCFSDEELRQEAGQHHLVLWHGGLVGGTLLLAPAEARSVRLRQMAVAPEFHGQGLGRRLVEEAEAFLRARATELVFLSAREGAIGFYERLGYRTTGAFFMEVTLPHRRMEKRLADPCSRVPAAPSTQA
ncbi:GNAT family N-acetyltransferase [Rhizosaccharibacter radicis]|uniref:GNAT family N-acetyltransferase n=1 Tax=Rhizosaccharibacter radicis TaxID=2782605 RepID=A0ABT1VUM4_9PROT|nr:GNAT family N-acetyltransferase [Acetobacteraceae bacterium KSS12]